jgi:hypothetical protein
MKQGLDQLRENKLAVAGCIALVLALTGLGLWTNNTADRTTQIERTINTQVVQALCNQPYTPQCLRRAVNIVKTCLADARCAALLALEPTSVERGDIAGLPGGGAGVKGAGANSRTIIEAPNSSQGNDGTQDQPRGPPGKSPPKDGDEGGAEEPASESPVASGGQTTTTTPEGSPQQPEGGGPQQLPEAASGAASAAIERVEGILECVGSLDVPCTLRGIGVGGR